MPDPSLGKSVPPRRLPPRDRLLLYLAALLALATGCAGFLLRIDGYFWFVSFAGTMLTIMSGFDPFKSFKQPPQ